jgi:hypothetical protein
MTCPFCANKVGETDKFCSLCGRFLNRQTPPSDFEIGRIAALDTIKKDILSWIGGGLIVLTILAAFGVNEVIKDRVSSSVDKRLEDLKRRIDEAESQSQKASARAQIESETLEADTSKLTKEQKQLEGEVSDLGRKKTSLVESIGQVDSQKTRMEQATNDVMKKEAQLKRTIESENLTTVFAKLQHDFYRIRTLTARVQLILAQPIEDEYLSRVVPGALAFKKKSQGADGRSYSVAQFYRAGDITDLMNSTGHMYGVLARYEMFQPFEVELVNQPISVLDKIESLNVTFGVIGAVGDGDTYLREFTLKLGSVTEIQIELELNSVPLPKIIITREELMTGKRDEELAKNSQFKFDSSKEIGNAFADISAVYNAQLSLTK